MKANIKKIVWLNGVAFLLLFWFAASHFEWLDRTLLSTPKETFNVIWQEINGSSYRNLFMHTFHTMSITLEGWGVSLIVGTIIGMLFGYLKFILKSFEIVIEYFRAIPPVLIFPLMLVSFNYENASYVWTVVFGCLPIMILTVSKGIQTISQKRFELLKVYKVKRFKKILVKLVEILPSIFLGARLTFSFALIITVVSEMIFTPRSGLALGALARDAEMTFDTPLFYAVIVLLGFIGFFTNLVLRKLEDKLR